MCPGPLCPTCVRDLTYHRHHAHHAKATWPISYYFLPRIPRRNNGSPTPHFPTTQIFKPYATEVFSRSDNCCSPELTVKLVYSPLLVYKHLIQGSDKPL